MKIHDFSYFNAQQITDSKKSANSVTDQDFDLDLQTTMANQGSDPVIQGSGWVCHPTGSLIICSLMCNKN